MIRNTNNTILGDPALGDITYEYDYFSGSQINILFGDVVIDTAAAISYQVQQTKTPVYGYANQYYTFVAPGKILVQGSITIAFKETGYLLWPLKRFAEYSANLASMPYDAQLSGLSESPRGVTSKSGAFDATFNPDNGGAKPLTSMAKQAQRKRIIEANVEQMIQWTDEKKRNPKAQPDPTWRKLGTLPDDVFEDYAEVLEDAIWYGSERSNPFIRDRLFSKNIVDGDVELLGDRSDELIIQHRRADQYPPIDIFISYGDMSHAQPNHTVKRILDVSFVGQSQVIEISGQPTMEQYEFIARNVV